MLLITGTGRSGTSLLAKYCLVMGNDPGGEWNEEADAGYEDDDALQFTETADKQGLERALMMETTVRLITRTVVKHPQLVLLGKPKLLHNWLELTPNLRVLVTKRPFEAVAQSWAKRPDPFRHGPNAECIAAKMRSLYQKFMANLEKTGIPYHIVPMLTEEMTFAAVYEALVTFGGLNLAFDAKAAEKLGLAVTDSTPQGVWNAIYDPKKRHH